MFVAVFSCYHTSELPLLSFFSLSKPNASCHSWLVPLSGNNASCHSCPCVILGTPLVPNLQSILLALGAPLLLSSLLDKAPRQGDRQEFAADRRVAIACSVGSHVPGTWSYPQPATFMVAGQCSCCYHIFTWNDAEQATCELPLLSLFGSGGNASCHSCPLPLLPAHSRFFYRCYACELPLLSLFERDL